MGYGKNGKFEGKRGLYIGMRAGQLHMESLAMFSERMSRSSGSLMTDISESVSRSSESFLIDISESDH